MDNIPPSSLYDINNNNNNNSSNNNPFDIQDMVAAPTASHLPPSNPTSRDANVAKRYRPAPAKTFQCRGYGDCHMVFSRSEHLARHIRKHTGERPFTCHCGKQFSRLDNLRQHAQTVHSDKQEENERMMRDLTALHTSMTAAHKAANARGKRAQQQHQQHASASASSAGVVTTSANNNAAAAAAAAAAAQLGMGGMNNGVKVEELQMHRSLSSANNYGLGRSILQEQTILRPALTSLDLDSTMHRNSYSYSPDSTSTSSACQGFPPTPPITPPTAIPFVTPISPFGVQQQQQQHQQQQQQQQQQYSHPSQPARSTSTGSNSSSNHSNMPPASPFLPPSPFSPPPQSSHPGARHPLVVGHPVQVVPTQVQQYQQQQLLVPHSRPSIPLSPNPSPHQAGSLAYFSYPPAQQGPGPQGDREPHRQPTHISPTGLLSGPPDDQQQQQQLQLLGADWGLSQSFPYTEAPQSWEDQVSHHRRTSSPASVSESMLTSATHRARQTGMARAQTTVPFHSTLPRSATPVHQQQQQQGHLGYASGHTAGPSPTMTTTTTTGGVTGALAPAVGSATTTTGSMMSHHPGAAQERRLGPHPHPPPPPGSATPSSSTTAGAEAGLSLDGSPSWSSAMTPTLQGALFYQYQHPDQPPHLAGSSSHHPVQQPHLPSRTQQQQQYLSRQSQHHPPPQQLQRRQSRQQQQQQQQLEQEEAAIRQADLQAGAAPSHMGSIAGLEDLEEDYIQQYVAMAQAQAQAAQQQQQHQQQAYYLVPASNSSNSNGLHPRGHPFRTDEGAPPPRQGPGAAGPAHPPTPTSATAAAYSTSSSNSPPLLPPQPPSAIKYESPSLRAGALQLLPESGCE